MKRLATPGGHTAPARKGASLWSTLLLALVLALGLISLSGCKELEAILARRILGANHGVPTLLFRKLPVVGMVSDHKASAPGARAWRRLFTHGNLPYGGRVEWMPPLGATGFEFPPGDEPLPGGPPFVWDDIPAGEGRTVVFRYSAGPDWGAVDTFTAFNASGDRIDTVVNVTEGLNPHPGAASTLQLQRTAVDTPASLPAPSRTDDMFDGWRMARTFLPRDMRLTTERCQQLVDWVQSDAVFFALRLPISPTTYLTQAHRVSFYPGDPYSSTLQLVRTTPIVTLPLTLRLDRLSFAALSLPAAAGEEWITLGAGGAPAACPADLDLAPNTWTVVSSLLLDLSHQPDNCTGCVLPGYFCYEGQDAPFAAALDVVGVASYQGEGVTCLGPEITDLGDTAPWVLSGAAMQIVTPTEVISIPHSFYVPPALGTVAFSLSMTSTLDAGWGFYHDLGDEPDLGAPITLPFSVSGYQQFWLVSAPLPPTTADGPYSVVVSATAVTTPSDVRWTSDLIWVGDWVAPPPPRTWWVVYLPLVVR